MFGPVPVNQASRGVFSKSLASEPGRVQALTCLHTDQDIEAGVTNWPDDAMSEDAVMDSSMNSHAQPSFRRVNRASPKPGAT